MTETGTEPVGVVGDDAVADRIRDAGFSVETGTNSGIPDSDRIVAVGEAAMTAIVQADTNPKVLPVDAGRGVRSVPRDAVAVAVEQFDAAFVEPHPVLSVTAAGEPIDRAFWDVTLVTADAARISEYAVDTATDHVGTFRADGVVVATAAGSPGYTRRIGGPVLAPAAVGVVAPIAPFATNPDHWVLPLDSLTVTVERDEATVALFVDGEDCGTVGCTESVALSRVGTLRVAITETNRSRFR